MITIETERLLLRPFREGDLDDYARLCADPEIMRFMGDGRPLDRQQSWRQIAFFLGHWRLRGFGLWAVEERATGCFLGRIGHHQPEGWPGFEVGWLIDRARWGEGFASEGGAAALSDAFERLGHDHVISVIAPRNTASIRVAEKIGERFEGRSLVLGHPVVIYGARRP